MPIENPVISTNKDLFSYFGFVYAKIIPPIGASDQYYLLLSRNAEGIRINPKVPFTSMMNSEELKQAVQLFGYNAEILWGYQCPNKKI